MNKKRIERTKRKREKGNDRERDAREGGKTQSFGKICLLDHESSVEVGYGFSYDIRIKLLIENDMY